MVLNGPDVHQLRCALTISVVDFTDRPAKQVGVSLMPSMGLI